MKQKIVKYSVLAVGSLVVLFVAFFLVAVSQLPSKAQIGKILSRPLSVSEKIKELKEKTTQEAEGETIAADEAKEDATEEAYIPSVQPPAPPPSQTLEKIKLFMAEDPKDIRVCENLNQPFEIPKSEEETRRIFDSEDRNNPYIEALRTPIRAIFQDPNVAELISEIEPLSIEDLNSEEKETFLSKIGFYAKAAKAAAGLYQQKSYFEQMGDRASHLTALAKLASLKPNLSSDSRVQDYCLEVENALKFGEEVSVEEERKALLSLLDSIGVKPSEVGFDPTVYNKLLIKFDKNQLRFDLKNHITE